MTPRSGLARKLVMAETAIYGAPVRTAFAAVVILSAAKDLSRQ